MHLGQAMYLPDPCPWESRDGAAAGAARGESAKTPLLAFIVEVALGAWCPVGFSAARCFCVTLSV